MFDMTDGCPQRHLPKMMPLISQHSLEFLKSTGALAGSIFAAALALSSTAAQAEETIQSSCKNGDLVRRVVVVESNLSSGQSCEVIYWKDSEAPGVRQVLWTAKQDAGYCYSKALTMVNKLSDMGWTCNSFSQPIDLPADRS